MIWDITVGAMAAVPIPTINLAISRKKRDIERALKIEPRVKIRIPNRSVVLFPNISTSFPRMGAQAAVEIACARADQVVLLYAKFMSNIKAGPSTVDRPPTIPTKKAASP